MVDIYATCELIAKVACSGKGYSYKDGKGVDNYQRRAIAVVKTKTSGQMYWIVDDPFGCGDPGCCDIDFFWAGLEFYLNGHNRESNGTPSGKLPDTLEELKQELIKTLAEYDVDWVTDYGNWFGQQFPDIDIKED